MFKKNKKNDVGYLFKLYTEKPDGTLINPYMPESPVEMHGDSDNYPVRPERSYKVFGSDNHVKDNYAGHIGFSGIGIADPTYSLYSVYDLISHPDLALSSHQNWEYLPKSVRRDLKDFYDTEGNTMKAMNKLYRKLLGNDIEYVQVSPKFKFSKYPFSQLRNYIKSYWDDVKGSSAYSGGKPKLALMQVPLNKIITSDDIVNNKATAQRDTPYELVAKQYDLMPVDADFDEINKEWYNNVSKAIQKQYNLDENEMNDTLFRALDDSVHGGKDIGLKFFLKDYNNAEEEAAKKSILAMLPSDGIVPSDENEKFVIDDLSNWRDNKMTQANITDALMDCLC